MTDFTAASDHLLVEEDFADEALGRLFERGEWYVFQPTRKEV